jgi:uncharacterized membrane protein
VVLGIGRFQLARPRIDPAAISLSFATFAALARITAMHGNRRPESDLKRYAVLYLATLVVFIPLDFLFLGTIAKGFFAAQVGDMLGEVRLPPAILFYLLYLAGMVIFANGAPDATWPSALQNGALLGLFCYATFELTAMSLLKHWSWGVVALDMSWGIFVTAVSAALGLIIANAVAAKI